MAENVDVLYNFIQFKLLAPDAIKKCQNINNEEKSGQTIILDRYNSRDFSIIISTMNSLKTFNYKKMNKTENFNNLNIFLKNNKHIKETHDKALAILNSRINEN